MEISTYEAWMEWIVEDRQYRLSTHPNYVKNHPDYLKRHMERYHALDQKRDKLLVEFPHSVVAEGEYSEHDYAMRWCWQNISPEHGRCKNFHSEYPACPLVLATEHLETGMRKDQDGVEKECEWKAFRDPGEHKHEGRWISMWLGKTGREYGFNHYFFAYESDYRLFLSVFPTFIWDASWNREEPTELAPPS
jgi:hypothetical protein